MVHEAATGRTTAAPPMFGPHRPLHSRIRSTLRRFVVHLTNVGSDLFGDDVIGRSVRRSILRLAGAQVPRSCHLHGGTHFTNPRNLRLGERVHINRNSFLDLLAPITMADDSVFGHGVTVVTSVHRIGPPSRRSGLVEAALPVRIERGAWIGANSTVMPGVQIGAGAVVAAGSLVRTDVPPNTVVAGVPARVIRTLDDDEASPVNQPCGFIVVPLTDDVTPVDLRPQILRTSEIGPPSISYGISDIFRNS